MYKREEAQKRGENRNFSFLLAGAQSSFVSNAILGEQSSNTTRSTHKRVYVWLSARVCLNGESRTLSAVSADSWYIKVYGLLQWCSCLVQRSSRRERFGEKRTATQRKQGEYNDNVLQLRSQEMSIDFFAFTPILYVRIPREMIERNPNCIEIYSELKQS